MPSTKTKSETKSSPWQPARGNLRDSLERTSTYAGSMGNFTPSQSDTYTNSLNRLESLATGPNQANQYLQPIVDASGENFNIGQDTLRATARGDFLSGNPYLDEIIRIQQENTANNVNGQFSAAGRYGSGAHTGVLTKRLGDQELGLRFDDYNNERARQLNASGMLFSQGYNGSQLGSQVAQNDLTQARLEQEVGLQRNALMDAEKTAEQRAIEWQNAQTIPIAGLGGKQSSVSKQTPNVAGQVMGGLTMGTSLLGNPMGLMGGMGGGGLMAGLGGLATGGPMGFTQGYAGMHSPSFWAPTSYS